MQNARDLYTTFTSFEPDRAYRQLILWPEQGDLNLLGMATGIGYSSDKWNKDGLVIPYIHADITPVFVLCDKHQIPQYPPAPIPPTPAPVGFEFSLLGRRASHCLDIHFINALTGRSDTLDFSLAPFYPWISAHPNGNTLVICYPGQIPIIMTGPQLEVTARGIVG